MENVKLKAVSPVLIVKKRDGRLVEFNQDKIYKAIEKAFKAVRDDYRISELMDITGTVVHSLTNSNKVEFTVEEIQDLVVESLKSHGYLDVASAYQCYREERSSARLF